MLATFGRIGFNLCRLKLLGVIVAEIPAIGCRFGDNVIRRSELPMRRTIRLSSIAPYRVTYHPGCLFVKPETIMYIPKITSAISAILYGSVTKITVLAANRKMPKPLRKRFIPEEYCSNFIFSRPQKAWLTNYDGQLRVVDFFT